MSPEGIGHFRFCNSFAAYHILISTVVRFEFQRITRSCFTFSFSVEPEHKISSAIKILYVDMCASFSLKSSEFRVFVSVYDI